ncbi:hypothetical protein [Anoxynatronum buryatiense]|uniref:Metallo-beta-lactamase domain-containing protein n=1 Tax=Anoxynatronum buryatiense TaxID=489973 RepID=A0AA45WXU7_9CLOT|nr:hypothetical protein [Anoxynatronum buryatiense]SMP64024.1 hypothetical protein SAMN06296020_11187 [Anoxynatronum buryatiense]
MRMVQHWDDFRIRLPQTTFRERMVLPLTDGRLLLESTESSHSEDSILIYDEQDQVLFAGDAFYPPPYHERETETTEAGFSEKVLRQIVAHDVKTILHGHGMPLTRQAVIRELGGA